MWLSASTKTSVVLSVHHVGWLAPLLKSTWLFPSALAAGEVEVGIEIPVLRRAPLAQEGEAIRFEEAAQILVGKEPLVAGVACALEAVDSERVERVDRSELVDDEHAPARPGDACELRDDELRAVHVVQRPERPDEIERPVLERQLRRVAF